MGKGRNGGKEEGREGEGAGKEEGEIRGRGWIKE